MSLTTQRFLEILSVFEKAHLPTVSGTTRIRYQLDLEKRIRPHFEKIPPSDVLGPLHLELFRAVILKDLSPKSVNNCTDLLGLLLRKGVEWGLVETNPMKLRKLKLPAQKYSWWEKREEIDAFLSRAVLSRNCAAYLLALECGLRLGEIVGISKKDVDLERCEIHVHRQWSERLNRMIPPKGNRERFIRFDPSSRLREALRQAIESSPDPEAVFVNEVGRRLHPTKLRVKEFPRLVRLSGVPRIRFHDLRHTFASWYMLEHDNIWNLRDILGHADIQTTQRYAHLSRRHTKAAALNLSRAS